MNNATKILVAIAHPIQWQSFMEAGVRLALVIKHPFIKNLKHFYRLMPFGLKLDFPTNGGHPVKGV
jgi:hypothetical protein